MYLVMQPSAEM